MSKIDVSHNTRGRHMYYKAGKHLFTYLYKVNSTLTPKQKGIITLSGLIAEHIMFGESCISKDANKDLYTLYRDLYHSYTDYGLTKTDPLQFRNEARSLVQSIYTEGVCEMIMYVYFLHRIVDQLINTNNLTEDDIENIVTFNKKNKHPKLD